MPRRREERELEEGEEPGFDFEELRKNKKNPMFARRRGGRSRARHHALAGVRPPYADRVREVPVVTMTKSGQIVKRTEKGDDMHWLVDAIKEIHGKKFMCIEIRPLPNICYVIVREVL
jgi:hypothetical protein